MRLKRGPVRVPRTPEMEATSGRLYLSQREGNRKAVM